MSPLRMAAKLHCFQVIQMPDFIDWSGIITGVVILGLIGAAIKFGTWKGRVDSDRKFFKKFIEEVKDDIKEVQSDIKKILTRLGKSPFRIASPIQLTEFGERISDDLEIEKWAQGQVECIPSKVFEMPEFELFDQCIEYVERQFDNSDDESFKRKIREEAYTFGLDTEQMRTVYAVVLRNKLIKIQEVSRKDA